MRERFPGLADGWARLDGPAGTQMVDVAIDAMAHHLSSGESANVGGEFAASRATGALVEATRDTVGRLLGAPPEGIVFGANMTTLTFALTRALALGSGPGDEIVCTRLDHDANVTPWVLAAHARGARVVLVPFDPRTGRFEAGAIEAHTGPGTRWIAVTGASNALGTVPDLEPVVAAARAVGARVFVDAVHLVPHRPVDVRALGVDALVTSAYKWYGPHAGVLWVERGLLRGGGHAVARSRRDRWGDPGGGLALHDRRGRRPAAHRRRGPALKDYSRQPAALRSLHVGQIG
jgi:selenocysteine lyase/cysteine desulfurase